MRKQKLKQAKHNSETKRIQRTLLNRGKLILKDDPVNKKKQDWTKSYEKEKMLHLDSTPLFLITVIFPDETLLVV